MANAAAATSHHDALPGYRFTDSLFLTPAGASHQAFPKTGWATTFRPQLMLIKPSGNSPDTTPATTFQSPTKYVVTNKARTWVYFNRVLLSVIWKPPGDYCSSIKWTPQRDVPALETLLEYDGTELHDQKYFIEVPFMKI
jgi:hypothetical protein